MSNIEGGTSISGRAVMSRQRAIRTLAGTAAIILTALTLTACGGKNKSSSATAGPGAAAPSGRTSMPTVSTTTPTSGVASADDPASLYRSGKYASAFESAKSRAARATGAEKERLSLIAGMSAAAMDRNTDAIVWLRPLTSSSNDEIAGRASAGVGLIEAEEGRNASAIPYLSAASEKLTGDEAAKARFYLAESQGAIGKSTEASASYRAAASAAKDSKLRRLANERLSLNAYTVQLGSYRDMGKANQVASSASSRTRAAGLPAPRVVTKSLPDGRSVFAVQVGVYREMSRAQADKARLGGDAVVTRTKG